MRLEPTVDTMSASTVELPATYSRRLHFLLGIFLMEEGGSSFRDSKFSNHHNLFHCDNQSILNINYQTGVGERGPESGTPPSNV